MSPDRTGGSPLTDCQLGLEEALVSCGLPEVREREVYVSGKLSNANIC